MMITCLFLFTQELADSHSTPCGLSGHIQAFGDMGADLRRRFLGHHAVPNLGSSFMNGPLSGLGSFNKSLTQLCGSYSERCVGH